MEEFSFRVYVTESLRLRAEGKVPGSKWSDVVRPDRTEPVDAEAVIGKLVDGGGLILE